MMMLRRQLYISSALLLLCHQMVTSVSIDSTEFLQGPNNDNNSSNKASAENQIQGDVDSNTLAEAIRVIDRRKREVARAYQPYSSFGSISGSHRYRYPLYRKRSYYNYEQPDYNDGLDYDYYDDMDYPRPSLFRERERGPKSSIISNGYFFNDKRSSSAPLHRIYDPPQSRDDAATYRQSKKSYRKYLGSPPFFESIDNLRRDFTTPRYGLGPDYYDLTRLYGPDFASQHLMNRRKKRSVTPKKNVIAKRMTKDVSADTSANVDDTSANVDAKNETDLIVEHPRALPLLARKGSRRDKRADANPFKMLENNKGLRQDIENELLAREYFKSLAKSIGSKRKRQVLYPRQSSMDEEDFQAILDNPEILNVLRQQLKNSANEVVDDAERRLLGAHLTTNDHRTNLILRETVNKIDDLDKMDGALYNVQRKLEQNFVKHNLMDYDGAKDKRRKPIRGTDLENWNDLFLENDIQNYEEECPVFTRMILNCEGVSEIIGVEGKKFTQACLEHEHCYMCGSKDKVSQHECDAKLSSAMEAACSKESLGSRGSPDCLRAAGDTFNALEDPNRYENRGNCPEDSCIRAIYYKK